MEKRKHEVALGMMPAKVWNGVYDATGGYLVVKDDGEIVSTIFTTKINLKIIYFIILNWKQQVVQDIILEKFMKKMENILLN